jgi:hypothetical protein
MIALRIVPLMWADPDSRRVLVPDTGRTTYEWRGVEDEGFYSTRQAEVCYFSDSSLISFSSHCKMVVCDEGDILVNVAGLHGTFVALFAVWFSTDEDTFEDTPLLTIPDTCLDCGCDILSGGCRCVPERIVPLE